MFNFSKLFSKKTKYDTEISSIARDFILGKLYVKPYSLKVLKFKFLQTFKNKKDADKLLSRVLRELEKEGRIVNEGKIHSKNNIASKWDIIRFIK